MKLSSEYEAIPYDTFTLQRWVGDGGVPLGTAGNPSSCQTTLWFHREAALSPRVYQLETGLSRHPEERPVRRDRRAELMGAVETALHVLNGPEHHGDYVKRKHAYAPSDFVEGERKKTDEAWTSRRLRET